MKEDKEKTVRLCGIASISDAFGDFVVLTDYGGEGISVSHQCETADEAAKWMLTSEYSGQQAVVRVVRVSIAQYFS